MSVDASLAKLTIRFEVGRKGTFAGVLRALFNPSLVRYSRAVSWKTEPTATNSKEAEYQRLRFQSSGLETLSLSLFFDTYEGDPSLFLPAAPTATGSRPPPVSVRTYTDALAALTRFDRELHRPPICELYWGHNFLFKGVLASLGQELTLFLPDGTPVRATCECSFTQFDTNEDRLLFELHSADVDKRYTVVAGDTLTGIAYAVYQDASYWRLIADANHVKDPRRLTPGQVLTIPKIR